MAINVWVVVNAVCGFFRQSFRDGHPPLPLRDISPFAKGERPEQREGMGDVRAAYSTAKRLIKVEGKHLAHINAAEAPIRMGRRSGTGLWSLRV
jgi:hypothetical protein